MNMPDPSSAAIEPRRRGPRPGSRSGLQQQQSEASRGRILEATRQLLADHGFDAIAIDDILSRASVSRATFYRHFKSKTEVAFALYDVVIGGSVDHFDRLGEVAAAGRPAAIAWIDELIAIYRANGPVSLLILQLGVTDRSFHERLRQDRRAIMTRLAATVPGFAAAQGRSARAVTAGVAIDFMLMQLDRICVEIAVHDGLEHADLYVRCMADQLLDHIRAPA